MSNLQDKELQSYAFEIFKSKSVDVDEAYTLAKDFLSKKKDKNGLDIVDGIRVSCEIVPIFGDKISIRFMQTVNQRDFDIQPLQFMSVHSESYVKQQIGYHVMNKVNEELAKEGCVTEDADIRILK